MGCERLLGTSVLCHGKGFGAFLSLFPDTWAVSGSVGPPSQGRAGERERERKRERERERKRERELFIQEGKRAPVNKATHLRNWEGDEVVADVNKMLSLPPTPVCAGAIGSVRVRRRCDRVQTHGVYRGTTKYQYPIKQALC